MTRYGFFGSYFELFSMLMLMHSTLSMSGFAMILTYESELIDRAAAIKLLLRVSQLKPPPPALVALQVTADPSDSFLTSHPISSTGLVLLRAEPSEPSP